MNPRTVTTALAIVALLLVESGSATSAAIATHPVQASHPPKRIVSLVPAVTEMLFAIGAGDRVVAVSSFDSYPAEADRLPRVGALLDPDVERTLSLRPDLVVVYHSQKDLIAQLARAGIATFPYAHGGLGGVTETIRRLGERLGAAPAAARLAAGIDSRIDSVRALVKGRARPRTLIVFGREALALRGIYASGGVGFIHDMVTAAGGDNIFADIERESVQASTELIIARRPEVILELSAAPIAPDLQAKEREVWSGLSSVPAVRTGRVHFVGDPRTLIAGPRVAEGVELLAAVLGGKM